MTRGGAAASGSRARRPLALIVAVTLLASTVLSPAVASAATGSGSVTIRLRVVNRARSVVRDGGADRYAVAHELLKEAYPGYAGIRHVIIASGVERAMADPLAAGGLCGLYDAPLLLVRGDWLTRLPAGTASAMAAIAAANPGVKVKIHVVGGPATVPAKLMTLLGKQKGFDPVVDRVGGADRFEVAANIAARMRSVMGSGYPRTCLIANGHREQYFPYALAASAISSHNKMPLLLVKSNYVPPATAKAIGYYSERVVVGGTNAVDSWRQASVRGTRVSGADRFQVAVYLADWAISRDLIHPPRVGIANRLADSLTGGAALGKLGGPLLFTDAGGLSPITRDWLSNHRSQVVVGHVIGGEASVTPPTFDDVRVALGVL